MRTALLLCTMYYISAVILSPLYADQMLLQDKSKDKPQIINPENIQGCYELTMSTWRPNLKLGEDYKFITPPHRIQLLAEHGTKGWEAEGFIVRPAPGTPSGIHPRGYYWLPKGPQSIEITWTTGFDGVTMLLRIDGEGLRGMAKTFWDFARKRQTADVVAHKVECQNP